MRSSTRIFARSMLIVSTVTALCALASCTVGPSRRPPLATFGGQQAQISSTETPPRAMPTGPGGPGRSAAPVQWGACPESTSPTARDGVTFTVRCARVVAPMSYRQPERGNLVLQVSRAVSPRSSPGAPPLIVLPADPGAYSYEDIADIASSLPEEITDHYAVMTLDARGTGESTGIDCVGDGAAAAVAGMAADPRTTAGAAQRQAIARQLTFDCGDMAGAALTTINSTYSADDLDTLRAALGVDAISLIASGGSATIGAVYAHRYPGRVAAMVVDSPVDPLTSPQRHATESASAAERLFTDFAAACASFGGGCPLGTDPRSTVQDLVTKLSSSGVASGSWVMTGGSVLTALLQYLPDSDSWPGLATAIAELDSDHATPLARLVTASDVGVTYRARLSAHTLYTCNDSSARLSPSDVSAAADAAAADAPLFGPFTASMASLCSGWPAPDEALGRLSATGAAPIVVIGSVRNPRYPYREAQSVAGQLASAVLISWQSGDLGGYSSNSCLRTAISAYFVVGTVPDRGLLCPA